MFKPNPNNRFLGPSSDPPAPPRPEEVHKRFLYLTWDWFYPAGGMGNVHASYDTLEEAIAHKENMHFDEAEIFDCDLRTVVWRR